MLNSSPAVVASYLYDPYGRILSQSGPLANANLYRFSSKELHVNSGLVCYLYRFYDPNLQRWPNRDPLGETGFELIHYAGKAGMMTLRNSLGLIAEPNPYLFVVNNPSGYTDPVGLDYIVVFIPGFSGAPHQVVYGGDGNGGSYTIECGPRGGGLNRVYGPGHYTYSHHRLPPSQLAYPPGGRPRATCPAVDKILNGIAAGLGSNNNTPPYCVSGKNCWSMAPIWDNLSNNLNNSGTPYPPITTQENLPPTTVIQ
jgi:RHS repeat-associated protein